MHRDETNPNKKAQCSQAAENAGKENETRDAKHREKVKQLPHFPPRARPAASAGGTAGSAATGLSAGSGSGRQNRFGHNGKERGRLTQAGNGRLVAVTATKSTQSVFPRQSRQTARFCTAQPYFMLERPQRIILDATNPDPWD